MNNNQLNHTFDFLISPIRDLVLLWIDWRSLLILVFRGLVLNLAPQHGQFRSLQMTNNPHF